MLGRHHKVLRDRAAGIVFDWRKGHGSALRLVIAGIVSLSFGALVFAFVEVRDPARAAISDQQIDLTFVDLDADENRGLAGLIDRETLFHRRWDVSDSAVIDSTVGALLVLKSPRTYQATLREMILPEPEVGLVNLPGLTVGALPPPERVEAAALVAPLANWWVEVRVVDGPEGIPPIAYRWPKPDAARELSEGEMWLTLLAVDWRGDIVINEPVIESENARTAVILAQNRDLKFQALPAPAPLRWWKLEARVVNRPLSE